MGIAKDYVALTDPEWYSYLSARPRVDGVNCRQPHGGRRHSTPLLPDANRRPAAPTTLFPVLAP